MRTSSLRDAAGDSRMRRIGATPQKRQVTVALSSGDHDGHIRAGPAGRCDGSLKPTPRSRAAAGAVETISVRSAWATRAAGAGVYEVHRAVARLW